MMVNPSLMLARSYVMHRAKLLQAAQKILRCRRRAEDIVQEAFLKAAEHANSNTVWPAAYLLSVVRNLAIDHYRRCAFEYRLFTNEEHGWEVATPRHAVESSLWSAQCLEVIERALAELPERTRHAFEMHRVQGLTQRDIARRLGISATLVNFMIRDAMEHCRTALEWLEYRLPSTAGEQDAARAA